METWPLIAFSASFYGLEEIDLAHSKLRDPEE